MEICKERFEAWLQAQDPSRKFDYYEGYPLDRTGCLMCNFFRETISKPHYRVGFETYSFGRLKENGRNEHEFPEWLKRLIPAFKMNRTFTAGEMQARYRELFPETNPEPVTAHECKEPICST